MTARYCTTGFAAKRKDNGNQVFVTAGHCIWANKGVNQQWEHDNHNLGKAKVKVFAANANADVGIIGIYSNNLSLYKPPGFNKYMKKPAPPTLNSLNKTVKGNLQAQGYLVCRMGAKTGKKCGSIVKTLGSNKSCATNYAGTKKCYTIKHTIEVSFDSKGGDSGGPVFSNVTNGTGYGLHVHSDDENKPVPPGQSGYRGWYNSLDWASKTLKNKGWEITWCKTWAC